MALLYQSWLCRGLFYDEAYITANWSESAVPTQLAVLVRSCSAVPTQLAVLVGSCSAVPTQLAVLVGSL